MAKKNGKQIAKKDDGPTALAVAEGYGEFAGSGFEGTTQEDFSMPFISVLQALSPQISGEAKVAGAEVGMLLNTVTGEMVEGKVGLEFVPTFREQVYVEWVPRKEGGGFVGRHELSSEVVVEAKSTAKEPNKLKTEAGNDLIQTAYIYGIVCQANGQFEPVIIAFTSTKLKVYRHLMTRLNQFQVVIDSGEGKRKITPPLFAHLLRIRTVDQKNAQGNFMNFEISSALGDPPTIQDSLLKVDDERFEAAVSLKKMIQSGQATANYESQGASEGEAGSGADQDVPF